jgi:glycosyltransferase involved in cell wall biosynthesis
VLVSRLAVALKLESIERAIAAATLLGAETGMRLVIVGDGPARDRLGRAALAANLRTGESTVILAGELADPRPAYAAADIVLGMGGSALRAMAFEKPVVVLGELGFARLLTSDSASTFLWQGFYGLGDGDTDPEILAQLLKGLLADPQRRAELGRFARTFVESKFNLVTAGERQIALYEEWIRERPHRARVHREALRSGLQLFAHKVRQRLKRRRGDQAAEDFNAIDQIQKSAKLAEATARQMR